MMDKIFLLNRLYDAVLDLTQMPRSQLDMLLENPDPIKHAAVLRRFIVPQSEVDMWDMLEREVHAVPG